MDDLSFWLRLAHTPGLGSRTVRTLLAHFKTPKRLFTSDTGTLKNAGCSEACVATVSASVSEAHTTLVETTRQWLEHDNHQIIHWNDDDYPTALRAISDPPILLYVSGQTKRLTDPSIAIVGSRKASLPARRFIKEIVEGLTAAGITIVSGLARGIDAAAHETCVERHSATIAVMGTGLDTIYPAAHRGLADAIPAHGALVSEFPLGTTPKPWHFPRRNRIISGLSIGVVVAEAAARSGTLTTARHALEQGREVMAIPGSVSNPLSAGCHQLIRDGAILVQSATEILSEVASQIDIRPLTTAGSPPIVENKEIEKDPETVILLDALGYEPVTVDALISRTGRSASEINTSLLKLEMSGHIVNLGAGRYTRC